VRQFLHPISLPRTMNDNLQARISGCRMTQSGRQSPPYTLRLLIARSLSLRNAVLIDRFAETVGNDPATDLLAGDASPVRVDECRLLHRDRGRRHEVRVMISGHLHC
jgi:hypothetical protein